jgi:hypothetical protein
MKNGQKIKEMANQSGSVAARNHRFFGAPFFGQNNGENFAEKFAFIPCVDTVRLLETSSVTARNAAFGEVILSSKACSGLDSFRHTNQREEVCPDENNRLAYAISSVSDDTSRNKQTVAKCEFEGIASSSDFFRFATGFFEAKPRGKNPNPTPTSIERTPTGANHP